MKNRKDRYIYPAIFNYSDDGITVMFPDIQGCFTCANTEEFAYKRAKEALELNLYSMEKDGEEIPTPTNIVEIKTTGKQAIILIEVWMPLVRASIENQAMNKTVTLPKWLYDIVKDSDVNCSQLLQEALMNTLGLNRNKV